MQDQPGEEKPGKSEGELGSHALIYVQVQLYGNPKLKRKFVQCESTFQKRTRLSVSFDDQPPVVINRGELVIG